MATQADKAQTFTDLHVPGNPVVLFNIWDPGSAKAVVESGAKAVATGSHGVANAFGYEDGEFIPLDIVLSNAERVVIAAGELPVSMDFEAGYGETADEVKQSVIKALQTGIVGVNIEDKITGIEELRPLAEQVERLKAVRAAADELGIPLFINARTDLFAKNPTHDQALLDQVIERAQAFAEAGASGLFVPGLIDLELIKKLTAATSLPVNIIRIPNAPSTNELAEAGVARISYGPIPYLQMIEWFKQQAKPAIEREI